MKTQIKAVAIGALVTVFLWASVLVILLAVYGGNLPFMLTGLAAFLPPVLGGCITTRLGQADSAPLGAVTGLTAGVSALVLSGVASRLAPNMTLAGGMLLLVGAIGGSLSTLLRYPAARALFGVAALPLLVALVVGACAPIAAGTPERSTAPVVGHAPINLMEQAELRNCVMIEAMEFDLDRSGNEKDPYVRRLTITDTQTVDLFVDALNTDLQVALKVACIPEYRLLFHLQDGTVQEFGYSCGGASFIRGHQSFWGEQDYHPPEQFDVLIEEQLALSPPEPIEASINLVEEAGLTTAVELDILRVHTSSRSSEDGIGVAQVSFESLQNITDTAAVRSLVAFLDTTLDLVPRSDCVPDYQLRFTMSDGTLHDLSYGCGREGPPIMRGAQPFWRGMEVVSPAKLDILFNEQIDS